MRPHPWREDPVYVASRVIATLGVKRAAESAGTPASYDGRLITDLAALVEDQRSDGGWGWCRSCRSDPDVTGIVLIALAEGLQEGHSVDDGVLSRALSYVRVYANRTTDVANPANVNQKAFLLYAAAPRRGLSCGGGRGRGGRARAGPPGRHPCAHRAAANAACELGPAPTSSSGWPPTRCPSTTSTAASC